MPKRSTQKEFIEKSKSIHNNKYDYSLVEYKNNRTKIIIICNNCMNEFSTTPDSHINSSSGCPACSRKEKWTKEKFIEVAQKIHNNKYDYSLVKCNGNASKISIICNSCDNVFEQKLTDHIYNLAGCPYCAGLKRKTTEQFIRESKEVYQEKYDYSLTEYKNNREKITMKCNSCQNIFQISPKHHIHRKQGCPNCADHKQYSQAAIDWLESLKETYDDIQHAENGGEYKIEGTNYKVDGYSPSWSRVFEYHGAFWHGCPHIDCFPDRNAINPVSKKTYGELFEATKLKKKIIESTGLIYTCIWDCGHEPNLG